MSEVETVCDRVIFIQGGKVVANDTPKNLARTLDRCNVSLLIDENNAIAFREVCAALSLAVSDQDGFSMVSMREDAVAEFLAKLGKKGIPLHGLTVTRATLEDYFMNQASSPEDRRD